MTDNPTPEQQAQMESQMRAPKGQVDPEVSAQFNQRFDELQARLDTETRKREDAERRAQDAETALHAERQPGTRPGGSRQIPIMYVVRDDHAAQSGDVKSLVDDINKDCKDIRGFQELSVGDFLALNADLLDAEAKGRGFTRGSRYSLQDENGDAHSGYHLFSGMVVIAGLRDTSPQKQS